MLQNEKLFCKLIWLKLCNDRSELTMELFNLSPRELKDDGEEKKFRLHIECANWLYFSPFKPCLQMI